MNGPKTSAEVGGMGHNIKRKEDARLFEVRENTQMM